MGKDWESCELGKIGHSSDSEPLWWEKIGKVANRAKLVVLSLSEQVQWEKIVKTDALKKRICKK